MKIDIKKVIMNNFMKFTDLEVGFGDKTIISGKNATGKTTIKRAIQYVLGIKGENGKKISGIITHDENGETIADGTNVTMVIDVDGEEKSIQKSFFSTYSRKGEPTGTSTDCFVNGIKKKPTEYSKWIDENLLSSDKLQYCMNANALLMQDSVKQRAVLEKAFFKYTDEEILGMDADFELIKPILADGTVKEIKSSLNKKIYGGRGRSAEIGLKQQSDQIEPKIKELEKQKVDIDLAEVELAKSEFEDELQAVEKELNDNNSTFENFRGESDGLLDLKFKANDIARQAAEELGNKKAQLERDLSQHRRKADQCEIELNEALAYVSSEKKNIVALRKEWEKVNAGTVEDTFVCKECGRPYDDVTQEEMRKNAEEIKEKELHEIEKAAEVAKATLDEKEEVAEEKANTLETLSGLISCIKSELENLPSEADLSKNEEYVEIMHQIEEKEKKMDAMKDTQEHRAKLETKKSNLIAKIHEADKSLGSVEWNENIDNRIEVLSSQKIEIEQKIADFEKQLSILDKFDRMKNELLEKNVNDALHGCTVSMFRTLANGDTEECCEFMYKGEPYGRNLNLGYAMLTEIEICRAFQKAYDVELPIIIDNAESLDGEKIPNIPNQLILIKRTDDEEISITNKED